MNDEQKLPQQESDGSWVSDGLGEDSLPKTFTNVYSLDDLIPWGNPTIRTLLDANSKLAKLNNHLMARIQELEGRDTIIDN